jgi:hypothetical protein
MNTNTGNTTTDGSTIQTNYQNQQVIVTKNNFRNFWIGNGNNPITFIKTT